MAFPPLTATDTCLPLCGGHLRANLGSSCHAGAIREDLEILVSLVHHFLTPAWPSVRDEEGEVPGLLELSLRRGRNHPLIRGEDGLPCKETVRGG